MSIGDRDAGGTRRSFPVPPGPAKKKQRLLFSAVLLVQPHRWHCHEAARAEADLSVLGIPRRINCRKSRRDPMESWVESALACPRRTIWEKRTVPAPIVEPKYMRSIRYNQKTTPCIKWREKLRGRRRRPPGRGPSAARVNVIGNSSSTNND